MNRAITLMLSSELLRRVSVLAASRNKTVELMLAQFIEDFVDDVSEVDMDVLAIDAVEAELAAGAPLFEHDDVWRALESKTPSA